ncbi:unnamed protein product [Lactuca saligna]|uniref:Uncharacterized protein n=1 Tax=Lactuca saligna TaxID=75948 RepID=A0AA35ZQ69_LACSI|nr:unnamed protein product [Lactuca saligna]
MHGMPTFFSPGQLEDMLLLLLEMEQMMPLLYMRESKPKLEDLLQKWSEWHNRHQSSSHDSNVEVESGEWMYFPALNVGLDKPSTLLSIQYHHFVKKTKIVPPMLPSETCVLFCVVILDGWAN